MSFMTIVFIAAAVGFYFWWSTVGRGKMMEGYVPALKSFMEKTGYRIIGQENAPLEQQAEWQKQELTKNWQAYELHYVRDYFGSPVEFHQYYQHTTEATKVTTVMGCYWKLVPKTPPKVLWEVVDKNLSPTLSFAKLAKSAFENWESDWKPSYATQIKTDDPELDRRFAFYGNDTDAVKRIASDPGLRQSLLDAKEVCLSVRPDAISFADPMQKNLSAQSGGTIGAWSRGFDMQKNIDAAIPTHESMAELLARAAKLSS